eukprot:5747397-Amphidinium_carterae.1
MDQIRKRAVKRSEGTKQRPLLREDEETYVRVTVLGCCWPLPRIMKDCHPSRMSNMLADMDPEPNSVEKINNLLTAMNLDLLPGLQSSENQSQDPPPSFSFYANLFSSVASP